MRRQPQKCAGCGSRCLELTHCEAREANEASGEAHVSDETAGGGSGDALRDFCTGHAEPSDGETAKVAEDTTADVAAAKAAAKAAEDAAAAAKAAEDAAAASAAANAASSSADYQNQIDQVGGPQGQGGPAQAEAAMAAKMRSDADNATAAAQTATAAAAAAEWQKKLVQVHSAFMCC